MAQGAAIGGGMNAGIQATLNQGDVNLSDVAWAALAGGLIPGQQWHNVMQTNVSTATMAQLVKDPEKSNPYVAALFAGGLTPVSIGAGNAFGKTDWGKVSQHIQDLPRTIAQNVAMQTSKPSAYIGQVGNVKLNYSNEAISGIKGANTLINSRIPSVPRIKPPVIVNGQHVGAKGVGTDGASSLSFELGNAAGNALASEAAEKK